eukprot:GFUD01041985.1.p2 GENE.GFUD01041985.1~~GFUD01041985.1.p2  ORF type:complete len:105 (-),score=40.48 GFUD01041985.1:103-417(-)
MNFSFLVFTFLASIYSTTGMVIPTELMEEERLAFFLCDSDRMVGLTWKEVKQCEERFAAVLSAQNIPTPSEEDFEAADLNGDGTLLKEEWKQWAEEYEDTEGSV